MKQAFIRFITVAASVVLLIGHAAADPTTWYVATTGSDSTPDGSNPATPYLTIEAAYTVATDGDTVSVGPGTFTGTADLTIAKAVRITGAGMDQTIRKGKRTSLNHADAVIEHIRLTGYESGGTLTFVKEGAGGTARHCDISGNTRTSTAGTGVMMYCGTLTDCVITNNINSRGGEGVGLCIYASADCLVENCLIADNNTGYGGNCGGLYISNQYPYYGNNVTVKHCTIAGNLGGQAGGLYLVNNVNIALIDCLIADNGKLVDATASQTEDAVLNWTAGYTRALTNCIIAKCPAYNAGYTMTNCFLNVDAGLYDPYNGDYRIGAQSAARGAASDGTDIGYYQTAHGSALAVGCYAVTNRGLESVETTLVGTALNAEGTVTYEWDLDGNGSYETTGATAVRTFTTPGWNAVKVKATDSVGSAEATVEHVAYVCPKTTYVWSQSPNPAFPYATWETAAHLPHPALAAVLDGGKLQFTNEAFTISKYLQVYRRIEMCGTGKDNDSVLGPVAGFTVAQKTDTAATGTSIQRTSGDVINLRLHNTGSVVHSIAFGPGRSNVVNIYGESTLSNCVVRFGEYTGGDGKGIAAAAGLITHCVVSNCYNNNSSATYGNSPKGGEVYLSGTAKLRNSLVTGGRHTGTTGWGCCGSVYALGPNTAIENCTISGNTAGTGAGVFTDGAATVLNNIIYGNTAIGTPGGDWYDYTDTSVCSNNCSPSAIREGDGTVLSPPGFIMDDATGNSTWTFSTASPCANAGWPVAWATAGATDLFGHTRVQGAAIDIGCFEADMSQATCNVAADPTTSFGATNIVFSPVITGTNLPETVEYLWDFNGDGVYEQSGAAVTNFCNEGYQTVALKILDGLTEIFNVTNENVATVYPRTIYFDGANTEGAAFPYNTQATAAAKMSDALDAAQDGAEILVCAGRHNCDCAVLLNQKLTMRPVEGLSSRPELVRQFTGNSFAVVGHADAVLQGLVLDDNKYYVMNLQVNDGLVYDCVISNGYYTSGGAIGLGMAGGLVDRCEIVATRGTATLDLNGTPGLAVSLYGTGVLRNSLIRGNFADSSTTGRKAGIVCVKEDAVMENCTITGNTNRQYSAVTAVDGGTIRNCIIWDNECGSESLDGSAYWPAFAPYAYVSGYTLSDDGVTFFDYNCVSTNAFGGHDLVGDPGFATKSNAVPYSLSSSSRCVNAGLRQEWMTGAEDLAGNPRLLGRPDMGCFECQTSVGFLLFIR